MARRSAEPAAPRGKSGVLVEALTLLFGPHYTQDAAALFERERTTIRRWVDGTSPVPDYIWPTLQRALERHAGAVMKLAAKIGVE